MEVLPLAVSPSAIHYVYIRKHQSHSSSSLPADRTLFAVNLPIDCTERSLAQFFNNHNCGRVERVAFGGTHDETPANLDEGDLSEPEEGSQPIVSSAKVTPLPIPPPSLHTSGHTAHIIFLDPSSINQALGLCSLSSSKKRLTWPPSTPNEPKGLARLIAQYDALRPSLSIARDHADTYIASYEQQIEAAKAAAAQRSKYKKGEAIVDEDGFTLVTRGGTYGATLGGGVSVVSRRFQLDANSGTAIDAEQKKRKKKEKPDFYTFQVRERKRKDFMDLRRKFEQDKAKIAKLKVSRRFNPY